MDLRLFGQVAVVVGGAQGIGRAVAEEFAIEKARVVIVDHNPAVTATAKEMSERLAASVEARVADVVDYSRMQELAAEIRARLGRIDHVVFAVGIGSGKFGFPFLDLEPADWKHVLDVNVLGAVNVAHAFAPFLVEAKSGTMLFLASVAGQMGSQTDPPYSASKAALINFAQCAAKDLAPHGVRVNALCPGMVKTALNRSVWEAWNQQQPPGKQQSYDHWADDKIRKVVPMGRWQEPEDIAAMAVFLASDRAQNVVGQTMNVDGGYVMHW